MKISKSILGVCLCLVLFILAAGIIVWYQNMAPSATDSAIEVEAVLQPNNTGINDYKEYLLDIKMSKSKDCHVVVYPYIEGLGHISFGEKESNASYVPSSIGSDGFTESIAIKELKAKNIIDAEQDVSLIGFWFPDEAGQYQAKTYLSKLDTFENIKDKFLVCVYREKKYGKELSWSKIIPVTVQ